MTYRAGVGEPTLDTRQPMACSSLHRKQVLESTTFAARISSPAPDREKCIVTQAIVKGLPTWKPRCRL